MKKKEPIAVNGEVIPAGESREFAHTFDHDGIIREVEIFTNSGQEFSLQYDVYVIHEESMIRVVNDLSGSNWVGGNGQEYVFHPRLEFDQNDDLIVKVRNVSDERVGEDDEDADPDGYDYTANIFFDVHYDLDAIDYFFGGGF